MTPLLRWTMRLLLTAFALAALSTASSAGTQSHVLPGECGGAPGPAHVQALWADDTRIYAARGDGRVDAIDRQDGSLRWTWPEFTPDAAVLSIVGDAQRVYIAVSEVTNGADDPVIALDKATGAELWRTASLRVPESPLAADPFRLAVDRTATGDPYLYVGMNGGDILKLNRATGRPLTDANGAIVHYHPPDNDDSVDPNGIYALEVNNGVVYAARNWGNLTRDSPVDLANRNNTLLHLRADLTPASGDGEMPILVEAGGAERSDGIFAMWHDGSSLYAAGSTNYRFGGRDVRPVIIVHQLQLPNQVPVATRTGAHPGGTNGDGDDMTYMRTFGDGSRSYLASALSLTGDSTYLYLGTQTSGSLNGYLARLNKDLSQTAGWNPETSFGAGGVRALAVAGDRLVVGHECSNDLERQQGALVVESPKVRSSAAVLYKPHSGLMHAGRMDLVLRTVPVASETYNVSFHLQHPNGTVQSFRDLGINLLGTQFTPDPTTPAVWRGVRIPASVPDGPGYRVRVDIANSATGPVVFQDWAEGSFTIDRRAPDIEDIVPPPGATVTDGVLRVHVALRDFDREGDAGTLVDPATSVVRMNGVPLGEVRYESNGFYVDLGGSANLPLRQGNNDFVAEMRDRAGNLATRSWTVRLDSEVSAPTFIPGSGYVNDRRPILQAVVPEPVDLVSALFAGNGSQVLDVTSAVVRTAGTDGSTVLQYRPAGDLNPAFQYEWRLFLKDQAVGNRNEVPFRLAIRVDETDPEVRAIEPLPAQLLVDDRPKIRFSVADGGSGVQAKSVTLHLDGADRTRDLALDRDVYTLLLAAPLLPGQHRATVTASDVAGNAVAYEWDFRVDLDSPKVTVDLLLPPDQTALKSGDRVVVRVTALDDSTVRSVRLDARALDPNRASQEVMAPVPGRPGVYEANVTVKEPRTVTARVTVTVDDHSGHQGLASTEVRVDNNPPITVLEALPDYVGGSFELRWRNEPKDEAVGGSGVSHYRIEQQLGNQEWNVLRPRVTSTTALVDVPEGTFRELRYRIIAVDRAGNEQRVPSNVAETLSRGDPFTDVRLPNAIVAGSPVSVSATAVTDLDIQDGQAFLTLTGADGRNITRTLEAYGRLYMTNWNFTDVPPGDYVARLHFRAADGFELASSTRTVRIASADVATLDSVRQESPAPALLPAALVAAGAALLRRRRA